MTGPRSDQDDPARRQSPASRRGEVGRPSPRRFTLLDAMVLVAATGVGLAVAMGFYAVIKPGLGMIPDQSRSNPVIVAQLVLRDYALMACPLVVAWSVATLALSCRGPGGCWRRRTTRPGFVACLVSVSLFALELLGVVVVAVVGMADRILPFGDALGRSLNEMPDRAWMTFYYLPAFAGVTVALAWFVQALGRRWRPERSWTDRVGRLLGCCWVAMIPLMNWRTT